jgi:photosystem II stability/assembly factor-like uncharacterized protein
MNEADSGSAFRRGPPGMTLAAMLTVMLTGAWATPCPAADAGAEALPTAPAGDPKWVNVTGNVGGEKWGYAGVCTIACVPGADRVIAGVSERGLWASTDGGATWTPLGADDEVKITNRPSRIIFDPKDANTFWTSGCYGPGVFRTDDGGKTFQRLGNVTHVDGLAIDFADPKRQTLLVGLHEQIRSLMKSTDGGKTWQNIGMNLPEKTNHSTEPILLDARTYLINTAGWLREHSFGIYRTEDGGTAWTKVSDLGAADRPLVASDGAIYWVYLWGGGVIKSTDRGKTWRKLSGPIKRVPIELPGGLLLAATGKQLYASADGGETWRPCGPPTTFDAAAAAYNAKRNCLFISRSSDKKIPDAIARLDLPQAPGAFFPAPSAR